jgi:hypothetical protein
VRRRALRNWKRREGPSVNEGEKSEWVKRVGMKIEWREAG